MSSSTASLIADEEAAEAGGCESDSEPDERGSSGRRRRGRGRHQRVHHGGSALRSNASAANLGQTSDFHFSLTNGNPRTLRHSHVVNPASNGSNASILRLAATAAASDGPSSLSHHRSRSSSAQLSAADFSLMRSQAPHLAYHVPRSQHEYERVQPQRSGSRADLLEREPREVYEMNQYGNVGQGSNYGGQTKQYSFVRTCDGNFIRTTLPIHEFADVLDEPVPQPPAYYSRATHTLRRPHHHHHHTQAKRGLEQGLDNVYYCCNKNNLESNPKLHRQTPIATVDPESYATLRGRKQRAAAAHLHTHNNPEESGKFGRQNNSSVFVDPMVEHRLNLYYAPVPPPPPSHLTEETHFELMPPPPHHHHRVIVDNSNSSNALYANTSRFSRSAERNLDNINFEENKTSKRDSEETISSLLTREPPDGKERPEPMRTPSIKSNLEVKGNNNSGGSSSGLSRRSSKSDLLASKRSGNDLVSNSDSGVGTRTQSDLVDMTSINNENTVNDNDSTLTTTMSSKSDFWKPMAAVPPTSPKFAPKTSASSTTSTLDSSPKSYRRRRQTPTTTGRVAVVAPVVKSLEQPTISRQTLGHMHNPMVSTTTTMTTTTTTTSTTNTTATTATSGPGSTTGSHTTMTWRAAIKRFVVGGTERFFGLDAASEEHSRAIWSERRRRLAVKKFGGVKDEYLDTTYQFGEGYCTSRVRYDHGLTSELEGDRMVLKINKPPRNKDSVPSMATQGLIWTLNSLVRRRVHRHGIVGEHWQSRSYQPSSTGMASYFMAAEQSGGLAVCPMPRVHAGADGGGSGDELFFTRPVMENASDLGNGNNSNQDPYSRSWQLPRGPHVGVATVGNEVGVARMMSTDVGVSRIWSHLLDAAFDNSDRRKHGMGVVGGHRRLLGQQPQRSRRRPPESKRRRKLGGNCGDHRPFLTYWLSAVQIAVFLFAITAYGLGPFGADRHRSSGNVLGTNLELEAVTHLEPANFWLGPSAYVLIHLGAKYAPCMRFDSGLDRSIRESRLKERDTACCIRNDRAGCVQSPKAECSIINNNDNNNSNNNNNKRSESPRSNWWRPSEWYSKYPHDHRRSSGPVCGLDPAYCEAPASVAPYIWPDDITKWPICRRKTDVVIGVLDGLKNSKQRMGAEHMMCEIIGHPCCTGIRGECAITTREYCSFVKGVFHEEAALCSQVSCLGDVCGLIPFRQRDVPDQFYRAWTPIFIHAGVLHLAVSLSLQWWLMRDLEKLAGAARMSVIYFGSATAGNLASAIFVPFRAETGPGGAHFGLLACCLVEILHQWPMLQYPEMALLKLLAVTAVLFILGLLPWIDNYAHLFGFAFGFLMSYALLPFVTVGADVQHYERSRKVMLVWICLGCAVSLFLGLLLLFYVSGMEECVVCQYLNCIPITKDFCADQNNVDTTSAILPM